LRPLQEQWSLVSRDVEQELLPAAVDLGVTIVAHSPTGHGLLHQTHTANETPADGPRAILDKIAGAHNATVGQAALAWVHHRRRVHDVPVVPLPGTTRVSHLRSNVAACAIYFSDDELRQLDSIRAAP
jgi:aryl-alcohol dehydrogenase-like predicted oxidoreductase